MSSNGTKPRRRWMRRILALAAGLVLAALALELGVRAVLGEQPKFPRHVVGAPWGLRYNQPGARYRHKSQDVDIAFAINARGLRDDREHAYEKPEGVKRIVALGDSFTIGYEVEERDCFARVLERELRAKGVHVDVLNAGVSGFSTAEECLYLERELHKYSPDLVLVSFFENDLLDNLRTGLFELVDGRLTPASESYVPAGRLANLLNENAVLSWLSERSDAFCLLKESATKLAKARMVEEHEVAPQDGASGASGASGAPSASGSPAPAVAAAQAAEAERKHQRALAAAIFERLYAWTRARGIPLVIQSIPFPSDDGSGTLVDKFPLAEFDVARPGVAFLPMRDVLQPFAGEEQLHWEHSHAHWTPFAHAKSGEALAELITRRELLR